MHLAWPTRVLVAPISEATGELGASELPVQPSQKPPWPCRWDHQPPPHQQHLPLPATGGRMLGTEASPPPERRCPHRGCGKGAPMTPGWDLFESIVGQRHLAFLPVTVQRKLEPPEQGGIVVLKILGCPLPWPRPGGTGTQGCPREPPPPALAQASGVQGYPRGLALSLRAMGSPCFSRTHLRSLRDPHQPHVGHATRKSTAHPPRPEPGVPATLHGQAAFVSPEKENK